MTCQIEPVLTMQIDCSLKILVWALIAMIIPQQGDDIDFPAAPAAWHAGTKRRDNLRGSWGFWNKQIAAFKKEMIQKKNLNLNRDIAKSKQIYH